MFLCTLREPQDKSETRGDDLLIFVVRRHAGRRLNFYFRLEMIGTLKSRADSKETSFDTVVSVPLHCGNPAKVSLPISQSP